jgi:hypothetical protein
MVRSGRITEDEAAHRRATKGSDEFEVIVGAIRARHAGAHMDSAIAAGEMTPEEAYDQLARLRAGEQPKGHRARLGKHRPQP